MTIKRYAAHSGYLHFPSPPKPAETFQARLSPVPADARTRADLAGIGSASTAVLEGSKLAITGSFDSLKTAATTGPICTARSPAGVRGPAMLPISPSQKATSGTITGSVDLTPEQLDKPASRRDLRRDSQRKSPGRRPVGLAAEIGDYNP